MGYSTKNLIRTTEKYNGKDIYRVEDSSEYRNTRPVVIKTCKECGSEFAALLSSVKRGNGKFCSRSCSGKYVNNTGSGRNNPAYRGKIDLLENIKENNSCGECGEDDPYKLVFHHVDDGKEGEISRMAVSSEYNIEEIREEVDKCIVLCRNCHRSRHYSRSSDDVYGKYKEIKKLKEEETCSEDGCNEGRPGALVFHHTRDKNKSVSKMVNEGGITMDELKEEVDKCVLVCSNCHAEKHIAAGTTR